MDDHINTSLKVKSDLKNLSVIRSFIKEAAQKVGLNEQGIDEIKLAVDEACANVMIHGYKNHSGEIEIYITQVANNMVITLCDNALLYNLLEVTQFPDFHTPLDERPLGGMGVYLVKQNADFIEYQVTPSGGNMLTLYKKIP